MQARETTFYELIQGDKQFQVPLYQRTFGWQDKQLKQVWSDILEQAEALEDGVGDSPHFLGSVVLAQYDIMPAGTAKWLIVDGQQRLTSITLALVALRDHLHETRSENDANRIDKQCLVNEFGSELDHYRLLPTQADRPAYLACVERDAQAGGGDNVGAAYRIFRTKLAAADDPADDYDLVRIETVIKSRLG
jgi:uncharacterized protein with ParB-like and HNH nuclease domain